MKKLMTFVLGVMLTSEITLGAEPDHRFVEKFKFPATREIAVVAEGDFEPRSIGSYSVRIYSGLNPEFPLDDYVVGIVRPRDGAVKDVQFYDFDGDGFAEIVVIVQSAGSAGYLSAAAFIYRNKSLILLASTSGLASNADPILALWQKVKQGF